MVDQGLADLPEPGDHIDDARWNTRALGHARELDRRRRRNLRRLDDHRVARCQRRRGGHHDDQRRGVPGNDDANHADRLAQRVVQHAGALHRHHIALHLVGQATKVVEPVLGHPGLRAQLAHQLAVLLAFEARDQFGIVGNLITPAHQQTPAARGRQAGPRADTESPVCGLDCMVNIGGPGFREAAPMAAGGGVHRVEGVAGDGGGIAAINVVAVGLRRFGGSIVHVYLCTACLKAL